MNVSNFSGQGHSAILHIRDLSITPHSTCRPTTDMLSKTNNLHDGWIRDQVIA